MALTKEEKDWLEAYEASPKGVMIEVYLPNLDDDAIWKLARWSEKIQDNAPALSQWMHAVAVEEIYRRASKRPVEAKTPRLPVTWTNSEVADALLAITTIAKVNRLRDLDDFFAKLNMTIAVWAAGRLRNELREPE